MTEINATTRILNKLATQLDYRDWEELFEAHENINLLVEPEFIEKAVVMARKDSEDLKQQLRHYRCCLGLQDRMNRKNRKTITDLTEKLRKNKAKGVK